MNTCKPTTEICLGREILDHLARGKDGELMSAAIRNRIAEVIATERATEQNRQTNTSRIDVASENLIALLDHGGALQSESIQRAAYQLRLSVALALGDAPRAAGAKLSLDELTNVEHSN
jgi:hypothetical protein